MSRAAYIDECKKFVTEFFKTCRYRLAYLRNKHGQPKGLVILFYDEQGNMKLGYSLCHLKKTEYLLDTTTGQVTTVTKPYDTFNKYVGIAQAIKHAQYMQSEIARYNLIKWLPQSLRSVGQFLCNSKDRLQRAQQKV